jgi:hypothetical protein
MHGDSLLHQMYENSFCELTRIIQQPFSQLERKISFNFHHFLRSDLPCDPLCSDPSFFRTAIANISETGLGSPCYGCYLQKRFLNETSDNATDDMVNQFLFPWLYDESSRTGIPLDTEILLLDSGAWYNKYNHVISSNVYYREMIAKLFPLLRDLQKKRKQLVIFWLGLPKMFMKSWKSFEWKDFGEKNAMIMNAVDEYNLYWKLSSELGGGKIQKMFYLDVDKFTSDRKKFEYTKLGQYHTDHVHWMIPGPYSIPSLELEAILHLFIRNKLKSHNFVHN